MIKYKKLLLGVLLTSTLSLPLQAIDIQTKTDKNSYIPYDEFTLPNGLRVVVHTDRKAPIVAVNIWYHVGSKDEPVGRSGFAHLFEHLMFQKSEHNKDDFFIPFSKIGATDQNGTTDNDRTNYFENVPTTALDTALFLESDRMGSLVGAIDQATLDEQRGVVQNEKRQGENEPYGRVWDDVDKALYPKGTPYHHSVIGSMNDLNAASLDDVKNWFKSWYGPNNAVLVLAGDIDVQTAKEKVLNYFGHIPASATPVKLKPYSERRVKATRSVMTDNVPQTMVMKSWRIADVTSDDLVYLNLSSNILGASGTSRLQKRLVLQDKLVDEISAFSWGSELAGSFVIRALIKKGVSVAKVEKIIQEELNRFLKEGPTEAELKQAKAVSRASFLRSLERIGGFGGKSDTLAECAVFHNDPSCFIRSKELLQNATVAQVQEITKKWLTPSEHTSIVNPGKIVPVVEELTVNAQPMVMAKPDPKFTTVATTIDREQGIPYPSEFPIFKFPAQQKVKLSNGMNLTLIERSGSPILDVTVILKNGGSSYDGYSKAGLAKLTMKMLTEGAGDYDRVGFVSQMELLGMRVSANANSDNANLRMSMPKENMEGSFNLFQLMLTAPKFDVKELSRVRAQMLSDLEQEKSSPESKASRVLDLMQWGKGHPYSTPLSGFESSLKTLKREDLVQYQKNFMNPENSEILIVGDINLAAATDILNKHFKNFTSKEKSKVKALSFEKSGENPKSPVVYLVDQPGAVQSYIIASQLVPNLAEIEKNVADDVIIDVLGGSFTARLNTNLREDKHWSYGSYASLAYLRGPRQFATSVPVQIDKTGESIAEIISEIDGLVTGKKPIKALEVEQIQSKEKLAMPGRFEKNSTIADQIIRNMRFDRPENYLDLRVKTIMDVKPESLQPMVGGVLDKNKMTWVIVGDLKVIKPVVNKMKLGEIKVVDADGKVQKI